MGVAQERSPERAPDRTKERSKERSLGAVVRDIGGNVDRIVRAELRFAIAELRAGLEAAGAGAMLILAGVACATLAAAFLLLGIMAALALVMPAWLAALLVAIAAGGAAAALIVIGRGRIPRQAASTSREIAPTQRPVT